MFWFDYGFVNNNINNDMLILRWKVEVSSVKFEVKAHEQLTKTIATYLGFSSMEQMWVSPSPLPGHSINRSQGHHLPLGWERQQEAKILV